MSKIFSKQEASAFPKLVSIAESTLTIKIDDISEENLPYEVSSEKIQLMEFSDAFWSVRITCAKVEIVNSYYQKWHINFGFTISNVLLGFKKDCFIKFSCLELGFNKTIPYEPYFSSGIVQRTGSWIKNFTVNLSVMRKVTERAPDAALRQFVSRKRLLDNISNTYGDETFSDFTFIVKGKEFRVHKLILAASSAVMRKMFTAEYKEKETSKCVIDDIEPNIFEALIRFMYSCKIPENLDKRAFEFFAVTHYYEIETLKDICVDEIQSNLSKANVTKAYELAVRYGLKSLSASAWEIIEREILMVFPPERINPMPMNEVFEILAQREKEKAMLNKYKCTSQTGTKQWGVL